MVFGFCYCPAFFFGSFHRSFFIFYHHLCKPEEAAVERSSSARALPAGYPHKPVFPTRTLPPWSAAPITVPGQTRPVGVGVISSSPDPPADASPLKSSWLPSAPLPACTTKVPLVASTLRPSLSSPVKSVSEITSSSPIRTYRTVPSPIKTVVQQGQFPFQGSSGSPCKVATDPASIKSLASAYTSRTSPLHSASSGSEKSTLPAIGSPKTSYNKNYSSLMTDAVVLSPPPVKSISSLSSTASPQKARSPLSSLSTAAQTTAASSELSLMNGSVSPVKYPSSSSTPSSPSSRLVSERGSSLQERIQATTQAVTSGVSAAINEAIDSYSVSGYGTLKSLSSSRRSEAVSSAYGSLRTVTSTPGTALSSNTVTVPVYSLINVIPATPTKPGPGSLKMSLPTSAHMLSSSSISSCVTATKLKSQLKSPPFITPPIIHPTSTSNQEILRDVADMREDLIRMSAILQTDPQTAAKTVQTSLTGTPKQTKLEEDEPFSLVEKVKEDLVKVSEILQKDLLTESRGKVGKVTSPEEEWEEFSKDEIREAQRSVLSNYFDEYSLRLKHQAMPGKDLELAKVVELLTSDIGASSLSKMAELKCRYEEEARRESDSEEKQKRVLKPSMSIQEHKLKMPPVSGMLRSPSEKDLSKLAESYQGSDTILESPEELSHEQDKSPLSDSGFETRSEKTPSAPQSAESTGPKPLFTDSPIPPSVSESRIQEVPNSLEQTHELCGPELLEDAASALHVSESAAPSSSSQALQISMLEDEAVMNKSMSLKEETQITTTRMVYHKPQLVEEAMSVRDIMKAFQSGRDPSKELAGLFEHKASQDAVKGDELTPRFLDRDVKSKPKVERIIEVHIEKGHGTADPTEVLFREAKKHPELYVYKSGLKELTDDEELITAEESLPSFFETSRVNTPVPQEEESRPSSAQLIADDSYKALKLLSQHSVEYCDDEQSEIRGESYRFAEKMLLSEKLEGSAISQADTEETVDDTSRQPGSEEGGRRDSPKREFNDGSPHKSAKFVRREEPSQFDKVTVLHYSTEPGSPKHAVWMRFTEDKQDRSRDKLLYEDRVDQSVKEAEEKLCEVSQFFRDRTEKLNDELQSPERKPMRRDPQEPRSWPSSPEKTQPKPKAAQEPFKSKLREPSAGRTITAAKKSFSLPSSPQKTVFLPAAEDKTKTFQSEPSSPAHSKPVSKVTQSQSSPTKIPPPVHPKPSVKKLQESKLPVYQFSTGGKVAKAPEISEGMQTAMHKPALPSIALDLEKQPNKCLSEASSNESVRCVPQVGKDIPRGQAIDDNNKVEQKDRDTTKSQASKLVKKSDTFKTDEELLNKNLRKKPESQIPVRTPPSFLDDSPKKPAIIKPSQIPTLAKGKTKSPVTTPTKTDLTFEILDNTPKDSNSNNLPSPRDTLEKVLTPPVSATTKESFKGVKTLPVYVGVQIGRQAEREVKGALSVVKQSSSLLSPDDDTLEQISFIDSSGKSPLTPETPSSEEVSYDLMARTPDGFTGFMLGHPSPIMEVSEDSETDEQGKVVFSYKEVQPGPTDQADLANANKEETHIIDNCKEITNYLNQQKTPDTGKQGSEPDASKDKGVAYIEFPPPPPLDSASEHSDMERKGSCASSEAEIEMMEVNLQEEQGKRTLTEPIIRIQPPSPVQPEDSQSDDEEDGDHDGSIFQSIPCKKMNPVDKEEKVPKPKGQDKNGNNKDLNGGTNGSNGSKTCNGNDYESEQNGNDQSLTDCSIATTAEFSHDTDATEIDSLDGYELHDEDDGLCEQADLRLFGPPESRKDVWATDAFRASDRSFPQTKLEVIEEEERSPEECQKDGERKEDTKTNDAANGQEQKPSDKDGFSDTYFSYKLEEELNSPFKTVATKGLDFDPWPSKSGEEVVDVGPSGGSNGEPKPFGLAVEDQSQATTPDTTPARTPTDDSTPTSEPNPFPFHEGKMFEMTRSGAIDMSKRDMVEERLQFFQIGPQSPCERTDLRMAIVADHLGLSWTELARELDFSVEEINFIRAENPNSLTAQSFMLLKKWVHREGRNATTDALSSVLTHINRSDIVTLLEGPIFDYGCQSVDEELQTPSDLTYEPPTPLRSDRFFSDASDTPDTPILTRPSDLSLTHTNDGEPGPDNDRRSVQQLGREPRAGVQGQSQKEEEEEEEEMTLERLQSLLDDIKLEGGEDEEEMTEEKVKVILQQVRQAEKDMCSVPGWRGETETEMAAKSALSETSPSPDKGSPDSLLDSLEQPPPTRTDRKNGHRCQSDAEGAAAGPSRGPEEGADPSQHKVQEREEESDSDQESTVTTVYRRRLILKGNEAKNIPGESVTEEQFMDEDGNLVTRKVIRKVVRRVCGSEERGALAVGADDAGVTGVTGVTGDGGVTAGGSVSGVKGKKKGKRSKRGHKEETQRGKAECSSVRDERDADTRKHNKKSPS